MKKPILYLCATALAALLANGAAAQSVGKTLVAQASAPAARPGASAPGEHRPQRQPDAKKTPPPEKKGAHSKQDEPRSGSSPRQDDAGADTRGAKGTPGSNTGSTGHGGMPGSGASSGSGGTADTR